MFYRQQYTQARRAPDGLPTALYANKRGCWFSAEISVQENVSVARTPAGTGENATGKSCPVRLAARRHVSVEMGSTGW